MLFNNHGKREALSTLKKKKFESVRAESIKEEGVLKILVLGRCQEKAGWLFSTSCERRDPWGA